MRKKEWKGEIDRDKGNKREAEKRERERERDGEKHRKTVKQANKQTEK